MPRALLASILLILLATAHPAFATGTPNGYLNPPVYGTGLVPEVKSGTVTTTVLNSRNPPANLIIYNLNSITSWTVLLPNPPFDGQLITIACQSSIAALAVQSTDGSTISSGVPASCTTNTNFTLQWSSTYNNWYMVTGPVSGGGGGGGGSTLTVTDGTHTVPAVTTETIVGGVVSGSTPNATVTVTSPGQTYTDGTHTVTGATQLSVTGGTVGGTTPNATLSISTGISGITFTDGTHTVNSSTQLTTTGITIGGSTPNATATVAYAANSDVWAHSSTTTALNPAVAATSIAPQTFTDAAGTFTINFNSGINAELQLVHANCPCTIANPSNVYAGLSGNITILQSATGSDTVSTWGSTWKFSNGTKPSLSAGPNQIDVLPFYCRTTTFCVVTFVGNVQ